MNKSRKLMSLLLVLVLALPMVFVTVNALAAETITVVKTTGGVLNVWAGPVKKPGTSIKALKNGTPVTLSGDKTYSTADKRWMKYITAPVAGWVDAAYVGTKAVPAVEPIVEVATWTKAKLMGTAPNSQINIWPDNELPFARRWQKPLMKSVPLGYVFENVTVYNNGTAYVEFKTADNKVVGGYVRTKYLANLTPVMPAQ